MIEDFDINKILNALPHRAPFLLVDKVVAIQSGESIEAIKNVTYNEPFFVGHFPAKPVMPGVLILEALAQATGILAVYTDKLLQEESRLIFLAKIDNAKFKRMVVPGDQLRLMAKLLRTKHGIWRFQCEALVGDDLAASAEITGVEDRRD